MIYNPETRLDCIFNSLESVIDTSRFCPFTIEYYYITCYVSEKKLPF